MISSEDVRRVTFEKAFQGYRRDDVDDYLKQVAQSMDELAAQNDDLQKKLVVLAQRIDQYRAEEDTLRTTMIVGFPGETEEQFEELCTFVRESKFDRLGAFTYSLEEGTPAAKMPNQIDEDVKNRRLDQLMMMQQAISAELLQNRIGEVCEVLVEGRDEDGFYGRSLREAPESDGCIHLVGDDYQIGSYVPIRIISADAYDLRAERAPSDCIPFHSVGSADSQLLPHDK